MPSTTTTTTTTTRSTVSYRKRRWHTARSLRLGQHSAHIHSHIRRYIQQYTFIIFKYTNLCACGCECEFFSRFLFVYCRFYDYYIPSSLFYVVLPLRIFFLPFVLFSFFSVRFASLAIVGGARSLTK